MRSDLDPRGTALPIGPTPGSVVVDIDGEPVVVDIAGDEIVTVSVVVDLPDDVGDQADDLVVLATLTTPGDTRIERRRTTLHGSRRVVDPTPGLLRGACTALARAVVSIRERIALTAAATSALPAPVDEQAARAALDRLKGPQLADTTALEHALAAAAAGDPPVVTVRAAQPAWHQVDGQGPGDYQIVPGLRLRLLDAAVDGRACVVFENGTVMYTDPAGLVRLGERG